jgi:Beta-ketoacyl synthase, N-terminal domain
MSELQIHVDGIGLYGPGLSGWTRACEVLAGRAELKLAPTWLPTVESLPPAERRRIGLAIRLSMAIGFEAVQHAAADPAHLVTVFSSTGGDCDNCHNLLETLASEDRSLSPTRFQNSVHNAPAGYWSIATACHAASTSLCAYDATFSAGMLEAATQAIDSGQPCLLLAYDTAYPEPLYSLRPIPYPMGVAMVLNPVRTAAALASLKIDLTQAAATPMLDLGLEALRTQNPSARSLPLMQRLAQRSPGSVVVEYLAPLNLAVQVQV